MICLDTNLFSSFHFHPDVHIGIFSGPNLNDCQAWCKAWVDLFKLLHLVSQTVANIPEENYENIFSTHPK